MNFIEIFLTVAIVFGVINHFHQSQAEKFDIDYQWTFINFTWKNRDDYKKAIKTKNYIPQNNAMATIKFYKGKLYITTPRACPSGTPVTLGYISTDPQTPKFNPLIIPFPNWATNDLTDNSCCDKLESVWSMEIDTNGVMWAIDGHRTTPSAKCPPKLVLYDLKSKKLIHTFTFPDTVCLSKGGFLNDIVVDDTDGFFAYITDVSSVDPGLIVYSREKDRAWKLRDASMFAEPGAAGFVVDDTYTKLTPIDGIALSPKSRSSRKVFYCAVTGLNLYSLSTDVLKNEDFVKEAEWRYNVTLFGKKQAQSDGMIIDNRGNLYYGLLPLYGVGKWNIYQSSPSIVYQNRRTMVWTDGFAFDDKGYLYLLCNHMDRYVVSNSCKFSLTDEVKFRIMRQYTGTKSYLF